MTTNVLVASAVKLQTRSTSSDPVLADQIFLFAALGVIANYGDFLLTPLPRRLQERVVIKCPENHASSAPLRQREWMHEDDAAQQNTNELTRRHDGGEKKRTKLSNGVQNAKLPEHGRGGEDDDAAHDPGMSSDEVERLGERTITQEPEQRNRRAAQVDPNHLIVCFHMVSLEELVLKSRRESIESEISQHQHAAVPRRIATR